MNDTKTRTHYRACNLCEAICGLKIEIKGDEIISIRGDENDPLSKGHICPKAVALKDIYMDKDRLKTPVKKTAKGWEPISWKAAFEEIEQELKKIQTDHGKDAIGMYLGNPNVHNYGSILYLPDLIKSLKSKNLFSATSADQLPHHFVSHQMFGHYFFLPVSDVDRTDYLLILGANPLVSNGSLMTAPGFDKRMKQIVQRGKVVVIDPRKTETADKASEHHFVKPGSDVLFLWSIVYCLFESGNVDLGRLTSISKGLEQVEKFSKDFVPEKVATKTKIPAAVIRTIAKEFAAAERAVCYGRMGVSTQQFGGTCIWLVNLINILTSNFDEPGGAMFTTPAMDIVMPHRKGKLNRWKSRVRELPERFGELPVATMIEEMKTEGKGQIKALITSAGNPVLSTSNGTTLEKAISNLDYFVAIDIYINETTQHANIILPPATGLEVSNYDVVFNVLSVQNTAKYSPACFEKEDNQKYDYEILQELARRMSEKTYKPMFPTPDHAVEMGLRFGAYASEELTMEKLKENPSGIDLGPLKSVLPGRLFTEDKKIDLAPELICADMKRVLDYLQQDTAETGSFMLIGRRQLRSNNSWMHNSHRLVKGGNRCTLLMHPNDANNLNITDGQEVEVSSKTGTVKIVVEVSEEMMQGVVSIPHGWGHDSKDTQQAVANAHPGVNVNAITDDQLIDELTGNSVFNGVEVELKVVS